MYLENKRILRLFTLLVSVVIFLFLFEETVFGVFKNVYKVDYRNPEMNIFRLVVSNIREKRLDFLSKTRDPKKRLSIAVVTILKEQAQYSEYTLVQKTLECYCKHFDYPILKISLDKDVHYSSKCPQKQFFFQRHCVLIQVMDKYPEFEYFLFQDADVGVVNPNHLLEEYVNPEADLVFYSRIFTFEFAAGGYIVKNTNYSKEFLTDWTEYDHKLPNSFHGADNSALQQVFLDRFAPTKKDVCKPLWKISENWDHVFTFLACTKFQLGNGSTFESVQGLPKYSNKTWARDAFLSDSIWSPKDFMFHGWKTTTLNARKKFAAWNSPISVDDRFNMSKCSTDLVMDNWIYLKSYIGDEETVGKMIQEKIDAAATRYNAIVGNLSLNFEGFLQPSVENKGE